MRGSKAGPRGSSGDGGLQPGLDVSLGLNAGNPAWLLGPSSPVGALAAALASQHGAGSQEGNTQDDDESEGLGPVSSGRASKRGRSTSSGTHVGQQDYAVRHQAAEQRRRARINERLDALRKLVPHDPRSNTASFLEDVIKYILSLKDTNEKLEQALLASHPSAQTMLASAAAAAAASRDAQQAQQAAPSAPPKQASGQARGGAGGNASHNGPASSSPSASNPASQMQASLVQAQVQSLQQLLALHAPSQPQQVNPHMLQVITPQQAHQATLAPAHMSELDGGMQQALLVLQQGAGPAMMGEPPQVLHHILANPATIQFVAARPLGGSPGPTEQQQLGVVQQGAAPAVLAPAFQHLLAAAGSTDAQGGRVKREQQGVPVG